MMQPTDFGNRHDRAQRRPLDGPPVWRILVEREVSSSAVIIREVAGQDAAQVALVKDEDMVQTLAPDRADTPLHEGMLPRAAGRRQHFTDPHAVHSLLERVTVYAVAVAEEIGRRRVFWEGIDDLLGGSCGGGMFGHIEVEDATAIVGEYDEDEEHAPMHGGHREEIDGDEVPDMVAQEGAPGLTRAYLAYYNRSRPHQAL